MMREISNKVRHEVWTTTDNRVWLLWHFAESCVDRNVLWHKDWFKVTLVMSGFISIRRSITVRVGLNFVILANSCSFEWLAGISFFLEDLMTIHSMSLVSILIHLDLNLILVRYWSAKDLVEFCEITIKLKADESCSWISSTIIWVWKSPSHWTELSNLILYGELGLAVQRQWSAKCHNRS